jgi:hypothetical protein
MQNFKLAFSILGDIEDTDPGFFCSFAVSGFRGASATITFALIDIGKNYPKIHFYTYFTQI